ncbi:MAG: DUF1223 domain-containing protein [Betaproteobacteria bacterium]
MRMRKMGGAILLAFCGSHVAAIAATPANCAAPVHAKSGPRTTSIVELYTSEGCDSCPPADKWFSTIDARKSGVIPLAFHVDYWDYIGWKDPFANPLYSQRQRETVTRQGSRTTYTPQVMVDGRDARAWSFDSQFQSRVREVASRSPRADVALDANVTAGALEARMLATIPLQADRADAVVFLAVTEDRLQSRVTAGENRSKTLAHDHVVRALVGPIALDAADRAAGKFQVSRSVTLAPDWKRDDLSLVAFVQSARTGEVLQAVTTPLCGG